MFYRRFITSSILEALKESPVILINGARQTGKTTLVKYISENLFPAQYISLDDLTFRSAAQNDPHGFIENLTEPVIIDEIQLAPDLLSAIKLKVDRERSAGQFILTGSANVLTLPRISESLAGRLEIFTLYPLSQGELIQQNNNIIDRIFKAKFLPDKIDTENRNQILTRIINGGFPEVIKKSVFERKQAWFQGYLSTILQRDIRELSNIEDISQMPRIMQLLAARTSALLNYAELSRSLQIPQTSLKRYFSLFEATFLLQKLLPWSGNLSKRFVKTPKLFFADTGLTFNLLGYSKDWMKQNPDYVGPLMENFIFSEVLKQKSWSHNKINLFHFRSQSGVEIDFVLENQLQNYVCLEVKSSMVVRNDDFKAIRWFEKEAGSSFFLGLVLYTGDKIVPFGKNLFAAPISAMW